MNKKSPEILVEQAAKATLEFAKTQATGWRNAKPIPQWVTYLNLRGFAVNRNWFQNKVLQFIRRNTTEFIGPSANGLFRVHDEEDRKRALEWIDNRVAAELSSRNILATLVLPGETLVPPTV